MKRAKTFFWVLGIVAVGCIAAVIGKGVAIVNRFGGTGGVARGFQGIANPASQFPGKNRINVLVIGKDYNHDKKSSFIYTKQSRSDTLILLSLDLEYKRISALSIPRDTYIPSRQGRINAAYAEGGEKLAMKTVGDLLGVQPDYFIALKPDAVKQIVDMVGGVEVDVRDRMKYTDFWGGLNVDLQPGKQVINGEQAIGYTRFRKVDKYQRNPDGSAIFVNGYPVVLKHIEHSKEEGDDRRMERQRILIRAVAEKAKTQWWQVDKYVDTALKAVETDLTETQLLALATLFRSFKPEQMQTATLEGKAGHAGSLYVFLPDERRIKAQVDWLLKGDETAANRLTVIAIQNGSNTKGAARNLAESLHEEAGYDAKSDGNAKRPEDGSEVATTTIFYGKANAADRANKIAKLVGGGIVQKDVSMNDDESGIDIKIILGKDLAPEFDGQRSAHR